MTEPSYRPASLPAPRRRRRTISRFASDADAAIAACAQSGTDPALLRAAARVGLAAAAREFDPDRGVDFLTHALPFVSAAVTGIDYATGSRRPSDTGPDAGPDRRARRDGHGPAPEAGWRT